MLSRIPSSIAAVLLSVSLVAAQTPITAPSNRYSPSEDVRLGRQAAAEVEQQLPLLRDNQIRSIVANIGQRLVNAVPNEFRHPEFRYSFDVVNVREINAFALPGGPMFLNRGLLEAAETEGQVAGVMAHELSHVVLRHGTAQATKAGKYQLGALAGAILGSIIGGTAGSVVSQGTQFGLGTAFLRFSREYERQADLLGAQIMARAGYDPRDMANMFKIIERQSGSGGPEWLSDHPNPGNRYDAIIREAQMLRVTNPRGDSSAFVQMRARLRGMPPAPSTERATRNTRTRNPNPRGTGGTIATVERPSSRYRTYREGFFSVSVPSNWRELGQGDTVTFAPDGGYGDVSGRDTFTHGMEFGVTSTSQRNVQNATDELINSLARSNPDLSRASGYSQTSIDNRRGLRTVLENVSEATGERERILLFSTMLPDGRLFYSLGVAPRVEFSDYQSVFNQVVQSIQLNG
jgi:Peptidase family M48